LVAIRLAARPARGRFTFGLKRAEILSAQVNGVSLLVLGGVIAYEAISRLISPIGVHGATMVATAAIGVVVNVAATWAISRANRASLNIEGAFQHILNDLYAFVATAVAGLIIIFTGFERADPIASLVVVFLMAKAGIRLLRDSAWVLLEAAPLGMDPDVIGDLLRRVAASQSIGESGVDTVGGEDEQIARRKGERAGAQHWQLIPHQAAA